MPGGRNWADQKADVAACNFTRLADSLSALSGLLAALGLVAMVIFVCYEVIARFVFNEPTVWVAEYATYLLVGIAFMGLSYTQKCDGHIQVELLLGYLPEKLRNKLGVFTNWLGLFFIVITTWQMTSFNFQEYVNDTRNWGLLATPQWVPEVFVSLGYFLFGIAVLADLNRAKRYESAFTWWIVPTAFSILIVALISLGAYPVPIKWIPLDWGSLLIVLTFVVAVLAWSGIRTALALFAVIVALTALFLIVREHSLLVVGFCIVLVLFFFLLLGMKISLALGSVGMFGLYFLMSRPQISVLAERSWNSINSFTLTAIPMFVLMGGLLLRSGVTTQMFDALRLWFGRTPGGIAHASIGACGVFAAVSGSSLATAATMGGVACPEMIKRGYKPQLTYGVIAAGGTLGIMIPPSIAMIIYGTTVGAPITSLFVAGVLPGLLLMASFVAVVFIWCTVFRDTAPAGKSYTLKEKINATTGVFPFLILIVAVMGSLYLGIATPTEAGGIGAVVAFVLCLKRGKFSFQMLSEALHETVKITSFILLIVVGAAILSWVFDALRLPVTLVGQIQGASYAPWMIMLIIALVYVLLGMFIDPISMMLMTLPVTYPIVILFGFDPIWFGIALVMMIEVGMITPPVGIILFVLRGISGDVQMKQIVHGVLPFVAVILLNVVIIYLFPSIVMWLPNHM